MSESKFRGYVIVYHNDPDYKGCDAYLLVTNWQQRQAKYTHDVAKATRFDSEADASLWAGEHRRLMGDKGHLPPQVMRVWITTSWTFVNPDPKERAQEMMAAIQNVIDQRERIGQPPRDPYGEVAQ